MTLLPPVLRHRNFALFFSSLFVSNTGIWMAQTAQGWLVYELTGSATLVGVSFGAFGIPMLVLPYFGGMLADRVDRRRLMAMMQTGAAGIALIVTALVASDNIAVWHLITASFLQAVMNSFDQPARQALLPDLVPEEDLRPAIALNSVVFSGPAFIGPGIVGLMIGTAGWPLATAFLVNALSFFVVVGGLMLLDLPPFRPETTESGRADSFFAGFRYVRGHAVILPALLLSAVTSLLGRSYQSLLPVIAEDVLDVGIQGLGLMASAAGLGAIAGALVISSGSRLPRDGTLALLSAVGLGLLQIGFAYSTNYLVSLLLLFLLGLLITLMTTGIRAILQTLTPREMMGRVMSLNTMAIIGLGPVGGFILGPLAEATDVSLALAVTATAMLLGVAALALSRKALREA
ncbi:MAG: MFS transporter [Chloroflexota bacterium]|nr:MFS transporter [Chloroflexota bacterium]MDP6757736.1 MFS transporter [Chloroflexota bacterium]